MGKKGKKGKKKPEISVDNVNTTEMTKKALVPLAVRIKEEIDKEVDEGDMFKIEKEKILLNWELDKKKEEELINRLRHSEKDKEEKHASSQARLCKVKQSDKHIMFEMNENLMKFKMECKKNYQNLMEEFKAQEDQVLKEKSELADEMNQQAIVWGERLRNVKLQHARELNDVKDDFERALREHVVYSEQVLDRTLGDSERKRNALVKEAENRKNEQIDTLLKKQKQEMEDLKTYYNNILSNNLSLIDSLKNEAEDMHAVSERCKNFANDAMNKYNNICEKYEKTLKDIKQFNEESKNLEKYQTELEVVTKRFSELDKGRTQLMWSNVILEQVYERTGNQVAALKKSEDISILEVERKKAFKKTVRCWNKILNYVEEPCDRSQNKSCCCSRCDN